MSTPEDSARAIFGQRAPFYTTSAAHTDPQVLQRVIELVSPQPSWKGLDVATGTGHTALALASHLEQMTGVDITPEMLAEAERLRENQGLANVTFMIADAHSLPFPDEAFDLVTCRRAAHHFSDIRKALAEMRRVLRPGGRLVVDDRSVPEDDFVDRCMNRLDYLHDTSHVRQYRPSEWEAMLREAGMEVEAVETYTKHRPLSSLTDGVSEENVAAIEAALEDLSPQQRTALNLTETDGVRYINHWYLMVSAVKG